MRIAAALMAALFSFSAHADVLSLKAGHPQTYVVKKGDTLWDISSVFLNSPWRWPSLWGHNPQIADPHWIYPGDRLNLVYIDGQPRLTRKPLKRFSPQIDKWHKGDAIPAMPLSVIQPYLSYQKIVDKDTLYGVPVLIGGERDAMRYAQGDVIFVNATLPLGSQYGVYSLEREFIDPDSQAYLGQEAILAATGRVIASGSISKVELLSARQEVKTGQPLLALDGDQMRSAFMLPTAAPAGLTGRVIAADNKLSEVGPLEVAFINKGVSDGAQVGQVFSAYTQGIETVEVSEGEFIEPFDRRSYDEVVALMEQQNITTLPNIYRGELMVFKTYDKVSLALVMNAEHSIHLLDRLISPDDIKFGHAD